MKLADIQPVRIQARFTRANIQTMKQETEIGQSNGIRMPKGDVLVVMHALAHPGWKLAEVTADGHAAKIDRTNGDLALIIPDYLLRSPTEIRPFEEELKDGELLSHIYWDYVARATLRRAVTWLESSYIREPCPHGMSGSGLYDDRWRLTGLVEWTNGFVWGPLDLNAFLDE